MKTALILLQLGSWGEHKKFVKAMLSDNRVVKQTIIWKILLQCCILPKVSKNNSVSPAFIYTEELLNKLQAKLPEIEVYSAFNYYNVETVLDSLAEDVEKIILQPLFPQYSSAVVGSLLEHTLRHLSKKRVVPEVVVAPLFYNNREYIEALTEKIKATVTTPQALVLSYHAIPLSHVEAGDPYPRQCEAESSAIKELLATDKSWEKVIIKHAYQSKFGKKRWLSPSTTEVIEELRKAGIERIQVVAAGFLMDCSETVTEINKDLRDNFYKLGGKDFQYITCFNADDKLAQIIEHSVKRYL